MDGKPLVTVGIPVRNGGQYLSFAVKSVLEQNYDHLEIIVSDNASTDDTADIVRSFAQNDSRINYIRQQEPLTAYDNFRYVLNLAHGQYFMWAAHDDTRSDDYIDMLIQPLINNQDVILSFGDLYIMDHQMGKVYLKPYNFDTTSIGQFRRMRKAANMQCYHIYGLWKIDALRKVPYAFCSWWADLPIMTAAAYLGKFCHVSGPRFHYMEVSKTNLQRVIDQDYKAKFSRLISVLQLLRATYKSCSEVGGYSVGLCGMFFVMEKQLRQFPGFCLRSFKRACSL